MFITLDKDEIKNYLALAIGDAINVNVKSTRLNINGQDITVDLILGTKEKK